MDRFRQVKQVLWQILGVNLLVAAAKIVVGLATGSISMVADGFHSIMDGSSNVLGLVGLAIAARPPDENHPYGHQKFEPFATLGIGLLLLLAGWNVFTSAVTRLREGGAPEVTTVSFAVMLVTMLVNWLVTRYERRRGQRLKSQILLADAAHTQSDIFVSLSVLVGLIAVKLGWPWVDAVVALIIVVVIGHTGWQIVRSASRVLSDTAVVDPATVEKIALSVTGVKSVHKIRSRGTDQAIYLDLHIQVDGGMAVEEAHRLGHLVQARLQQELDITDVVVHVEPVKFKWSDAFTE
ncbi:MAG: cation transporter [Chloroflexi bacterium]|nr:cation transporter [Chloroflexota bacterium]